jgi:hypothetical protein
MQPSSRTNPPWTTSWPSVSAGSGFTHALCHTRGWRYSPTPDRVGSGVDGAAAPRPAPRGMRWGDRGAVQDRHRRDHVQCSVNWWSGCAASADAHLVGRARIFADVRGKEAATCWRRYCRRGRAAGRGRAEPFSDAEDVAERRCRGADPGRACGPTCEVTGPRLLTFAEAVGEDRQGGRPPGPLGLRARGRPDAAARVGASAGASPRSSLTYVRAAS